MVIGWIKEALKFLPPQKLVVKIGQDSVKINVCIAVYSKGEEFGPPLE